MCVRGGEKGGDREEVVDEGVIYRSSREGQHKYLPRRVARKRDEAPALSSLLRLLPPLLNVEAAATKASTRKTRSSPSLLAATTIATTTAAV